jgi:uncharacterized OB-fold protein
MTQTSTEYGKPLPTMAGFAKEFYEHCRQGELRFQRCTSCGKWRHVPRHKCGACSSWEWEWARSSGRGQVFSWTVVCRPMHPEFVEVPYAPAIIEMEEGVRLVSWVVDCPPDELRKGLPVEVFFDSVTDEVTLPKFVKGASNE